MNTEISTIEPGAPAPVNKSCMNCDYHAGTSDKKCPRCRYELVTERQVRGFVPVSLLGGLLTLLTGIAGFCKVTQAHAAEEIFRADDRMKLNLALGFFIALGVCGGCTVICGLLELESGRSFARLQWRLIKASIAVAFAIEIFAAFYYWR